MKLFFVQRCKGNVWGAVSFGFSTLDKAKEAANDLDIGTEPEPLRIVDEHDEVQAWVSRNGWLPSGGLAPKTMLKDLKHPRQPIGLSEHGTIRFKPNKIIDWLFETGRADLNKIVTMGFPVEDMVQFWQLLGYSVSGFGDLSFVPEEEIKACDEEAARIYKEDK